MRFRRIIGLLVNIVNISYVVVKTSEPPIYRTMEIPRNGTFKDTQDKNIKRNVEVSISF